MKRKTEDQLVRLAFGDLTAEEASMLQAESASNPEAARTLAMYRRMKEELKGLADVPPDQLSKERLREAILKRGLKEKPLQRSYSWLWMPAAAAALAFGVVMVKGRLNQGVGPGAPVLLTDARDPKLTDLPDLKIDSSIKLPTPEITSQPVEAMTTEASKETTAERSFRRGHSYGDRHRTRTQDTSGVTFSYGDPGILQASNEFSRDKMELGGGPAAFDSMNKDSMKPNESTQEAAGPGGSMRGATRASKPSTTKTPVIVIQPETDDQTGARKAKEVEKTSDVLVGG